MVDPVTVIICAYTLDRWSALVEAVESVEKQTVVPQQVVLVVDHNDELLERARHRFASLTVVSNAGARGLSGARNTGVALATSDIVAFLDDDARANRNWLEELVKPFAQSDATIGVGGFAQPLWEAGRPGWFPASYHWVVGCSYEGQGSDGDVVRNPIGCNMAFRRDAFEIAGGFREGLGRTGNNKLGCEETEFSILLHLSRPDLRIVLGSEAVVTHRVPAHRSTFRYFMGRCWSEGLSKSQVATRLGSSKATTAERAHVLRTLGPAVGHELMAAARHGDHVPLLRAGAIVGGLLAATIGYGLANTRRLLETSVDPRNLETSPSC